MLRVKRGEGNLNREAGKNFPVHPPIDHHLIRFPFPRLESVALSSGLNLLIVEDHRLPRVWIRLGFDFGTKCEPTDRVGLMELLEYTLKKGTISRSYREIVDRIETAGGELEAAVSRDFFFVFGDFLKDGLESGLEIFSDVLQHPRFPEEEVEKERLRTIADLENEKTSPNFLAHRRLKKILYAPHPYSHQKTRESLSRITREDMLQIHQRYFDPSIAYLIFAGDITRQQAVQLAEKHLGSWQGQKKLRKTFPPPRGVEASIIHLVHRPGSEQVTLLLGNSLFPRNHPDFEKMMVMNRILGGGGSGRLFMYLREEKGFTYGAYSSMQTHKDAGIWFAQADVRPDVVAPALEGFMEQFRLIRREPVSAEELESAKRYLIGIFPLQNERPSSVAALALQQVLYGLPSNYWDEYLNRLHKVTIEDVQNSALRYVIPEKMATVVVGDATHLQPVLEKMGSVEVYDMNDEKIG